MDWAELRAAILAALDIRAEYERLGVRFPAGAADTGSGRIKCHAMGREDNNPSAVINVINGYYKDYGSDQDAMSLFDFAAKYGPHKDWREALSHYARETKLSKRMPKTKEKGAADSLKFATWSPIAIRGLCALYGVEHHTIRLLGGEIAAYPKNSPAPRVVVALPCYGPDLTSAPPRGYVLQAADGGLIELFQGPEHGTKPQKRLSQGMSGLIGKHCLKRVIENPAGIKRIFKVEGVSDLIAMQDAIPTAQADEILVFTNSGGATETGLPPLVAPYFHGQQVVVIGDTDSPGQIGAKFWCGELHKSGATVRHVSLPYDITENHGKDIRDFFADGHTLDDLYKLADEASVIGEKKTDSGPETSDKTDVILEALGIIVLGHREETITCFSTKHGRSFEISNISRIRLENLVLALGAECADKINLGPESIPGTWTFNEVKCAIAAAASRERLTDTNQRGVGIWGLNGRLCLVNSGEAALFNGKLERTFIPKAEGVLLHFGEGADEKWFDYDWLKDRLEHASPQWCAQVFQELCSLFELWDNWRYVDSPQLTAALVCATWLQDIWPWRPQVGVAGPTGSGKSVLMEDALQHLFQGQKMSLFTMKATEAAIRQHIQHTSRVLLIDEFESDANRQKILGLFRTSSRGAKIIRGTAGQKGVSYGLRHIPWVGAIEMGMRDAADRNRYIMLDLLQPPPNRGGVLTLPPAPAIEELGMNVMVAAVAVWKQAIEINDTLRRTPIRNIDTRITESFSVPASMMGAMMGLDAKASHGLLEQFIECRDFSSQQESDEEELVRTIWDSLVRVGHLNYSVGELITGQAGERGWIGALARVGIGMPADERYYFFYTKNIERMLLKGTKYQDSQIRQILERAKGAKPSRMELLGSKPCGIKIPKATIIELTRGADEREFFEENDGKDVFD